MYAWYDTRTFLGVSPRAIIHTVPGMILVPFGGFNRVPSCIPGMILVPFFGQAACGYDYGKRPPFSDESAIRAE